MSNSPLTFSLNGPALAEALAPLISHALIAALPQIAAALAQDGERLLSIVDAARQVKCRTGLISEAVRLPPSHPGHLTSTKRPGPTKGAAKGPRYLIRLGDLIAWAQASGPTHVAAFLSTSSNRPDIHPTQA